MAGAKLAAVQSDGGDLPLADRELDAAPGEAGIERVVVRVKAEVGLLRDAKDAAKRGRGIGAGSERMRSASSSRRSAGTARMPR